MGSQLRRVLIVEDEFIIADELAGFIRRAGHVCIGPVATLTDALTLIDQEDFDAAILDSMLGHDPVDPLADQIAERRIPFAFATGQADGRHSRYSNVPIIMKPYSEPEVITVLAKLVLESEARV